MTLLTTRDKYSPLFRGLYGILLALSLYLALSVAFTGGLCHNHLRAAYAQVAAAVSIMLLPVVWLPIMFVAFAVFAITKHITAAKWTTAVAVVLVIVLPVVG